jgi:hypothetical protein
MRTLTCLAFAVASPCALAHHSPAQFDTGTEIVLSGVVTRYDWKNPHIYLSIRTEGPGGEPVEQAIEAGSGSVMLPLGLTRDAVRIGEQVTIRANPSRRGTGYIVLGRELVKADGTVLPLFIGSKPSRAAPGEPAAESIAGTWFPPLSGFSAFNGGRRQWQLTEQARAAAARPGEQGAHANCIPVTAPTLMVYPVASQVEIETGAVRFHIDWMSSERVVHLDGRPHPDPAVPTLHGHSIGHWDGDTLVVDTTQFAAHPDGNALGLPSGPRKHLTERFRLSEDRRHLEYEARLEDPDYLIEPIVHRSSWDYRPDLEPSGAPCELDVARRFLSGQ